MTFYFFNGVFNSLFLLQKGCKMRIYTIKLFCFGKDKRIVFVVFFFGKPDLPKGDKRVRD